MIFFLYNTGWYVMYLVSARQLKQEVKAYIHSHPGVADVAFTFGLDKGKVTDHSFHWEENGKEFSFKGSMYDVVSMKKEKDKLVIKCIDDKKEKELKALMAKMNRKHKSRSGFAFSPYCPKTADISVRTFNCLSVAYNLTKDEDIRLLQLPLFLPPPDMG